MTADELFQKEFQAMMRQLRAENGNMSLSDIPLSAELAKRCFVLKQDMVYICNIDDEYYGRLNGEEAILLSRPSLKRRMYDSKGEFVKKDGVVQYKEVDVPNNCLAVVSQRPIGLKTKYKPKEQFIYVDYIQNDKDPSAPRKFIYILPRKYLYRVNMSALVISQNKMTRAFYSGVAISCTNGNVLFMYVIPYKHSLAEKAYRVLATGTDPSKLMELSRDIFVHWVNVGFAFNPQGCEVLESTSGRSICLTRHLQERLILTRHIVSRTWILTTRKAFLMKSQVILKN